MADDPFDPSKTRLFHSPGPQAQAPQKRKRPPPLPAARPDWHNKTRVLPIEHLLPELAKHHHQSVTQPRAVERPARLVRLVSKQRVYAWAVCLVLWVSVAAASGIPSPRMPSQQVDAADAPRAITLQTAVPAAERTRERAAEADQRPQSTAPSQLPATKQANQIRARVPVQPSAAPPVTASTPAPNQAHVSPRAAVEALAAGDTLAASHLYAALAKQSPDNLAYARAARILAQRAHAPGATP